MSARRRNQINLQEQVMATNGAPIMFPASVPPPSCSPASVMSQQQSPGGGAFAAQQQPMHAVEDPSAIAFQQQQQQAMVAAGPATPLSSSAPAAMGASSPGMLRMTKRLNVQISGTMAQFDRQGPNSASWQPMTKDAGFKMFLSPTLEKQDLGIQRKALSSAWIVSGRLVEYKNTFPVPLGVSISGVPDVEHINNGDKFSFTCLPSVHNSQPLTLFQADANTHQAMEWQRHYADYTYDNIHKLNVMDVEKQDYVFVNKNHPVIALLRANADMLVNGDTDLNRSKLIDDNFFKVKRTVLKTCVDTLREKVLCQLPKSDIGNVEVITKRADASTWCAETPQLQELKKQDPSIFSKPFSLMARLELTYEIPSNLTSAL